MTDLVSCCVAVGVPHLARRADHRRHRRVDDHVARDVQVGDAAVGVDHRERRARLVGRRDRGLDRLALVRGQVLDRAEERAEAVVRVRAELASASPCSSNTSAKNARTAWPKMIGSETFIIVAFRCSEKRTPCALASAICSARNASSARAAHHRGVDDLAREHRQPSLSTVTAPSAATCSIRSSSSAVERDRPLGRAEVAVAHRRRRAVLESFDHAPIECGCLRAYSFTEAGARRSELPSRRTGLTALPLTRS